MRLRAQCAHQLRSTLGIGKDRIRQDSVETVTEHYRGRLTS